MKSHFSQLFLIISIFLICCCWCSIPVHADIELWQSLSFQSEIEAVDPNNLVLFESTTSYVSYAFPFAFNTKENIIPYTNNQIVNMTINYTFTSPTQGEASGTYLCVLSEAILPQSLWQSPLVWDRHCDWNHFFLTDESNGEMQTRIIANEPLIPGNAFGIFVVRFTNFTSIEFIHEMLWHIQSGFDTYVQDDLEVYTSQTVMFSTQTGTDMTCFDNEYESDQDGIEISYHDMINTTEQSTIGVLLRNVYPQFFTSSFASCHLDHILSLIDSNSVLLIDEQYVIRWTPSGDYALYSRLNTSTPIFVFPESYFTENVLSDRQQAQHTFNEKHKERQRLYSQQHQYQGAQEDDPHHEPSFLSLSPLRRTVQQLYLNIYDYITTTPQKTQSLAQRILSQHAHQRLQRQQQQQHTAQSLLPPTTTPSSSLGPPPPHPPRLAFAFSLGFVAERCSGGLYSLGCRYVPNLLPSLESFSPSHHFQNPGPVLSLIQHTPSTNTTHNTNDELIQFDDNDEEDLELFTPRFSEDDMSWQYIIAPRDVAIFYFPLVVTHPDHIIQSTTASFVGNSSFISFSASSYIPSVFDQTRHVYDNANGSYSQTDSYNNTLYFGDILQNQPVFSFNLSEHNTQDVHRDDRSRLNNDNLSSLPSFTESPDELFSAASFHTWWVSVKNPSHTEPLALNVTGFTISACNLPQFPHKSHLNNVTGNATDIPSCDFIVPFHSYDSSLHTLVVLQPSKASQSPTSSSLSSSALSLDSTNAPSSDSPLNITVSLNQSFPPVSASPAASASASAFFRFRPYLESGQSSSAWTCSLVEQSLETSPTSRTIPPTASYTLYLRKGQLPIAPSMNQSGKWHIAVNNYPTLSSYVLYGSLPTIIPNNNALTQQFTLSDMWYGLIVVTSTQALQIDIWYKDSCPSQCGNFPMIEQSISSSFDSINSRFDPNHTNIASTLDFSSYSSLFHDDSFFTHSESIKDTLVSGSTTSSLSSSSLTSMSEFVDHMSALHTAQGSTPIPTTTTLSDSQLTLNRGVCSGSVTTQKPFMYFYQCKCTTGFQGLDCGQIGPSPQKPLWQAYLPFIIAGCTLLLCIVGLILFQIRFCFLYWCCNCCRVCHCYRAYLADYRQQWLSSETQELLHHHPYFSANFSIEQHHRQLFQKQDIHDDEHDIHTNTMMTIMNSNTNNNSNSIHTLSPQQQQQQHSATTPTSPHLHFMDLETQSTGTTTLTNGTSQRYTSMQPPPVGDPIQLYYAQQQHLQLLQLQQLQQQQHLLPLHYNGQNYINPSQMQTQQSQQQSQLQQLQQHQSQLQQQPPQGFSSSASVYSMQPSMLSESTTLVGQRASKSFHITPNSNSHSQPHQYQHLYQPPIDPSSLQLQQHQQQQQQPTQKVSKNQQQEQQQISNIVSANSLGNTVTVMSPSGQLQQQSSQYAASIVSAPGSSSSLSIRDTSNSSQRGGGHSQGNLSGQPLPVIAVKTSKGAIKGRVPGSVSGLPSRTTAMMALHPDTTPLFHNMQGSTPRVHSKKHRQQTNTSTNTIQPKTAPSSNQPNTLSSLDDSYLG